MSIEENIKTHGWQFNYVFDHKGEKQNFSYSIGLEESFSHPEIMIFGLKKDVMHSILTDVVNDIKKGHVFLPNNKTAGLLSGDYDVIFKPIKEKYIPEYAGTAASYYEKPFRIYVMLWPDNNNVLPTEDDCELTVQNEALQIV